MLPKRPISGKKSENEGKGGGIGETVSRVVDMYTVHCPVDCRRRYFNIEITNLFCHVNTPFSASILPRDGGRGKDSAQKMRVAGEKEVRRWHGL